MYAIVGPTGAGKSALAIALAKRLQAAGKNCEIISADAMQLYRGMDIGTAKVTPLERAQVKHHMLDVLPVTTEASVKAYQQQVQQLLCKFDADGTVPILVGGSGLYVNSVLYRFDFAPHDSKIRSQLEERYQQEGIAPLITQLQQLAPTVAAQLDLHNPRRIIRALETLLAGGSVTTALPQTPQLLRKTLIIGVTEARQELVARLDQRVIAMWRKGLVAETANLLEQGLAQGKTAKQAIGYAQAIAQLYGAISREEAIAQTQLLTRKYARRQMSWFKRLPQISWINSAESCDPLLHKKLITTHQRLSD